MGACRSKSKDLEDNVVDPSRKNLSMSKSEKVPQKNNEKEKGNIKTLDEGNILEFFPDFQTSQQRLFVLGTTSEEQQKGFADKEVRSSSQKEDPSKASALKDLRIGYACKKGLKPESPNQDDFCILVTDGVSVFGVFDGHGPYGHEVANFTHEMLPKIVVKDNRFKDDPKRIQEALKDAFPQTHKLLCTDAAVEGHFDCALSGTTATLVVLKKGYLYVANVGDSRAVLARGSKGSERAEILCPDHKPNLEAEKQRIENSGKGQIRRLEGDIPERVFLKDKMYPGLAMTRSIGDTVGIDAGVISTPDVSCREMDKDWRFLLLCSDGVWEFIESQEAVNIVSKFLPADVQRAAEALASEAWNRWIDEEADVVDDITVIIKDFTTDK